MGIDFDTAMDFGSSLAIIALLAWGYGTIRRRFAGARFGPLVLGLLFGLVAVLQMHAPISPVEGLIVDLRNVPVVLAGAFLGRGGLAVCMSTALVARYDIGGVGTVAGMAAILIAGGAGLAWHWATQHLSRRRLRHLIGLAAVMSLSLLAGFLLPPELAGWFFGQAAVPLVAMYMIAVPAVGLLLERERLMLQNELEMKGAADVRHGFMSRQEFSRELAHLTAEGSVPRIRGVLVLTLRHGRFLSAYWGEAIIGHVMGGLRLRLRSFVRLGHVIGQDGAGRVLIPLTAGEMANRQDLERQLSRAVAERAITLPGGDSARVAISTQVLPLADPASSDKTLSDLEGRERKEGPTRAAVSDTPTAVRAASKAGSTPEAPPGVQKLFAKADMLLVSARG